MKTPKKFGVFRFSGDLPGFNNQAGLFHSGGPNT